MERTRLEFLAVAVVVALASCTHVQGGPTAVSAPPVPNVSATKSPRFVPPPTGSASKVEVDEFNKRLLTYVRPRIEESDLPLGAGDLVEISVFDAPELSGLKLRIPLAGSVTLPLIGDIPSAGLTPAALQRVVRARLQQDYMHDPQVSVFVLEAKSQSISVVGAVRTGGILAMTTRLRLADALAMAGGLADDAGHTVYVIRHVPRTSGSARENGPPTQLVAAATDRAMDAVLEGVSMQKIMTTVDLDALVAGADELNLPLQAGDVINVPRAGAYYVGGDVEHGGTFPLKGRVTVAQAIVAAGGVKDTADWTDVRLYRAGAGEKREISRFNLKDVEKGTPTPEIQPDDVIIVGRSGLKTVLYGIRDFFHFGVGAAVPIQ